MTSWAKAVAIQPGARTLTLTSGARVVARDLLKANTPALTAENICGLTPG